MKRILTRRQFLQLALLSYAAAGCRGASLVPDAEATPSAVPPTLRPPGGSAMPTVALDVRFVLHNDAVSYGPPPDECQTVIAGQVLGADGRGVLGVQVHVWTEDGSSTALIATNDQGAYQVVLAEEASDLTYLIQLMNESGMVLWSDVIVAQAIPSCDLSMMTVNFVAKP
jgi:hypothetical protein